MRISARLAYARDFARLAIRLSIDPGAMADIVAARDAVVSRGVAYANGTTDLVKLEAARDVLYTLALRAGLVVDFSGSHVPTITRPVDLNPIHFPS